ncbi:hypothetical protein IWX90DRAFT_486896 [Phyllosticta citrichinensis]|uniref:Metallo-beta-lactamase domain-containing protein n=1 Tax=Phyllosticta citrichinensis TaxID=1130410 RepID=A0ABR1XUX4_9PEZI
MSASNKSRLNITHIGTATAILEIGGVNFLTDPFFSPAVRGMRPWETITDYEFSGDTVWIPELAEIRNKYHVLAAVLNLGGAHAPHVLDMEGPEINITMDGKQGARALREIGADVLVPMHFAEWGHFKQHGKELREAFEAEGIMDKVRWLTRGRPVRIY